MDCGGTSTYDTYSTGQCSLWIQGLFISTVVYGSISVLFIVNFNFLRTRGGIEKTKHGRLGTLTTRLLMYICGVFTLCSAFIGVQLKVLLRDKVKSPLTPEEIELHNVLSGSTSSILGVICAFLMHSAVSLLLIWRSIVIYRNAKTSMWFLLPFSGFVFLIPFVTGTIYFVFVVRKEPALSLLHMLLVYGAACLFSNLVFTIMIGIRLYLFRRHITRTVGHKYAGDYTSLFSIFIESGMILNVILALAIGEIIAKSSLIVLQLLNFSLIEGLVSFVIVYRVANGTAWARGTANELIAQHVVVRGTTLLPEERLSTMRFRSTFQTTQMSTGFNFVHGTASNPTAATPEPESNP